MARYFVCSLQKNITMVVYFVSWEVDKDLIKGTGKVPKDSYITFFSVLCRNSRDAVKCLEYHFANEFLNPKDYSLEDGTTTLKRRKIDSRGFDCKYLLMDGMKEPLILSDVLRANVLRINKIF